MQTRRGLDRMAQRLRAAAALVLVAALGAGCGGSLERDTERTGEHAKEDVRGFRDFLFDRGITIDTRTGPGY